MMQDLSSLLRLLSRGRPTGRLEGVAGIILAAGFGRRMGDLTRTTPKPLLPVLNCPLFGWNVAQLREHGIQAIIANTHYLSSAFEGVQRVICDTGIDLCLENETELSGPFGGVLACSAAARDADTFVVFAGDGFYDTDIGSIIDAHRETAADLTIGVSDVSDGSRYGVLEVGDDG